MDRAVSYVQKLEQFRKLVEQADTGCQQNGNTVGVDVGRKYDRIYVQTYHNGQPLQKMARYFVNRNSWVINSPKSFHQINERREFGTLDTIEQYDWAPFYGTPIPGTEAEKAHLVREAAISATHKQRGRPRKNPVTKP